MLDAVTVNKKGVRYVPQILWASHFEVLLPLHQLSFSFTDLIKTKKFSDSKLLVYLHSILAADIKDRLHCLNEVLGAADADHDMLFSRRLWKNLNTEDNMAAGG